MKRKMNDKGFSLVELIIVVAIMAILIGLLAPQYLKFVERSKKSADRDTVDQIIRAVQLDYADPETTFKIDGAKITLKPGAAAAVNEASGVTTGATGTGLEALLMSYGLSLSDIKLRSSQWIAVDSGNNQLSGGPSGNYVTEIRIAFSLADETVKATIDGKVASSYGTVVDSSRNPIR